MSCNTHAWRWWHSLLYIQAQTELQPSLNQKSDKILFLDFMALGFFYATIAICVASSNEQTKSILIISQPYKGEKTTFNMLLRAEKFKAFPTTVRSQLQQNVISVLLQSDSLLQQTLLNPNKNNHHHKWVLSSPKCAWIQVTLCSTCQQNIIASFWAQFLKQLLFIQVLALAKQQVNLKLVLCLSDIKEEEVWCLQTASTSKGRLSFARDFSQQAIIRGIFSMTEPRD